jgi:endo-1,4-beta-xylanase
MVVKLPRLAPPGSRLAQRREVLAATLAGLGLWASPSRAAVPPHLPPASLPSFTAPPPDKPLPAPLIPSGPPGLGQIAAAHGRAYGAAIQSNLLAADPVFAASVTRECGLLMPDYEAKWSSMQAAEGHFDFTHLDALIRWAQAQGHAVRGNALVWHQSLPDWVLQALTEGPDRARSVLDTHITRVLIHTRGAIREWDVVNEPVADPAGSDTPQAGASIFRDSPWLRALGPDYIPMALRMAKERDRAGRVALNEYGTEEAAPHHIEKRRRLLDIVRGLRKVNTPLDVVGLQGHLQIIQPFSGRDFTQFCLALRNEGVDLVVTEMDVREHWKIPDGFAARDAIVADRVKAFVDAALDGGVKTFITWGLQNNYSWLANTPHVKREDGLEHRGLPLDGLGRRTPYWLAMAEAFRRPA